jgi:hypothetical protein
MIKLSVLVKFYFRPCELPGCEIPLRSLDWPISCLSKKETPSNRVWHRMVFNIDRIVFAKLNKIGLLFL